MEYFYRAIYHKICEMVELKEAAVKELNLIYLKLSSAEDNNNEQAEVTPPAAETTDNHPVELPLATWMCKWEVMEYLKISESTYYRWRKAGKLIPRNGVGEDRYLWEDVRKILKKRIR